MCKIDGDNDFASTRTTEDKTNALAHLKAIKSFGFHNVIAA